MARAWGWLAIWTASLAACAIGPVESTREVAAPPAEIADRVTAGFQRLGLDAPRAEAEGTLRASLSHVQSDWARCRARLVGDGDGDRRMATAGRRFGDVEVRLTPAAVGTRVDVRTRFTGVYRNTATGYTFQSPCESTGAIERGLIAAAGGEG